MKNLFINLSLLLSFNIYAVSVDGILDEPEWQQAESFSTFYEVYPFTLEPAKNQTEVKIFCDPF